MIIWNRFYTAIVILGMMATLAASGCGRGSTRPDRAVVSGKVTYQGEALPGAMVRLVSTADPVLSASASLQKDGSYEIPDAPLGPVHIVVDTTAMLEFGPTYTQIPEKYADPDQSGLTYDVQPGENKDVNFDLQ